MKYCLYFLDITNTKKVLIVSKFIIFYIFQTSINHFLVPISKNKNKNKNCTA